MMMKINAPIILYSRNSFLVVPEEGLRVLGITMSSEGVLLRDASAKKGFKESSGWMMEVDGTFREFTPVGFKKRGVSFLSDFLGMTKVEMKTSPPKKISVEEFKAFLNDVVKKRKDQQAINLLDHLRSFRGDALVDAEVLATWPI